MSEYVVIYEQAEDGAWGAYLPDLPGVFGLGRTREEAEARVQEAVGAYAECMRDEQRSLPAASHQAGSILV